MKKEKYFRSIELRKQGYSFKEISQKIGVAKSTASIWTNKVILSEKALSRLKTRVTNGQLKAAETKRIKTFNLLKNFAEKSAILVNGQNYNSNILKIFCSLIYWCEGGKYNDSFVQFTNSEPKLINTFIELLRKSFKIDEKKFRACIHLHSYHSESKQLEFWSRVTNIPKKQFIKSFKKSNSGQRIRENYQGCLQIRYYDSNVSRMLLAIGRAFFNKHGSLV